MAAMRTNSCEGQCFYTSIVENYDELSAIEARKSRADCRCLWKENLVTAGIITLNVSETVDRTLCYVSCGNFPIEIIGCLKVHPELWRCSQGISSFSLALVQPSCRENSAWVMPFGSRNSSSNISPGWKGFFGCFIMFGS